MTRNDYSIIIDYSILLMSSMTVLSPLFPSRFTSCGSCFGICCRSSSHFTLCEDVFESLAGKSLFWEIFFGNFGKFTKTTSYNIQIRRQIMTLGGVYSLKIYILLWPTLFAFPTYSYAIRLRRIYTQGKSTGQAHRFAASNQSFLGSIASHDHRRRCFYCGL